MTLVMIHGFNSTLIYCLFRCYCFNKIALLEYNWHITITYIESIMWEVLTYIHPKPSPQSRQWTYSSPQSFHVSLCDLSPASKFPGGSDSKEFACNAEDLDLGWEDSLEKGMATHSSILAWRIPWMEDPGGLQSMKSQRVGYDWATDTLCPQHKAITILFSVTMSAFFYVLLALQKCLSTHDKGYQTIWLNIKHQHIQTPIWLLIYWPVGENS